MKFSRWLNSLTGLDHFIILSILVISGLLAWQTLKFIQTWYNEQQKDNPYAKEMRISPIAIFSITVPYSLIIYRLIGVYFTAWLKQIF